MRRPGEKHPRQTAMALLLLGIVGSGVAQAEPVRGEALPPEQVKPVKKARPAQPPPPVVIRPGGGQPPPPAVIKPATPPPPAVIRRQGEQPPPPAVIRRDGEQPPPPAVIRPSSEQPPPRAPTGYYDNAPASDAAREAAEAEHQVQKPLPNDLPQAHAYIRRLQENNRRLRGENQKLHAYVKELRTQLGQQPRRPAPQARDEDER